MAQDLQLQLLLFSKSLWLESNSVDDFQVNYSLGGEEQAKTFILSLTVDWVGIGVAVERSSEAIRADGGITMPSLCSCFLSYCYSTDYSGESPSLWKAQSKKVHSITHFLCRLRW